MPTGQPARPEPLLQPDDVCAYLGITKRTLYELVATRRIEHIKMGGRLRFRQHQIDAWLEDQVVEVKPLPRVRNQAGHPRPVKFSVGSRKKPTA